MNNSEKLIEFLYETLKQTKDLAIEQTPILFQEWIHFKLIGELFRLFAFGVVGAALVLVFKKCYAYAKVHSRDLPIGHEFGAVISFIGILICTFLVFKCATDITQLIMTPKAFLLNSFLPTNGCK